MIIFPFYFFRRKDNAENSNKTCIVCKKKKNQPKQQQHQNEAEKRFSYHPLELAYRFLLAEGITTLSLGASKLEDFNIAKKLINSGQKLTSSEISSLENIEKIANAELKSSKCEQCRSCLPCPSEIPIPEILRLRNIFIGYGQEAFAKERYNLIGKAGHWWEEKNASFCSECNECVPRCPSKLNIPDLLKQTHNLLVDKPKKRLWS